MTEVAFNAIAYGEGAVAFQSGMVAIGDGNVITMYANGNILVFGELIGNDPVIIEHFRALLKAHMEKKR